MMVVMKNAWTTPKSMAKLARPETFAPDFGQDGGMLFSSAISRMMRPYWRMTRGLTLGAQGIVRDELGRVLLVRHGYRPGWHFPGGGVEWNETVLVALERELDEEVGVRITAPPRLHGIFANFGNFPGDHICVYEVASWQRPNPPGPTREIAEQDFFATDELPAETVAGARRRLAEIESGDTPDIIW